MLKNLTYFIKYIKYISSEFAPTLYGFGGNLCYIPDPKLKNSTHQTLLICLCFLASLQLPLLIEQIDAQEEKVIDHDDDDDDGDDDKNEGDDSVNGHD